MTSRNVAHQAPLSMEFSRQEYWNGWLFPFPGDLPNPRIEPGSAALQAASLPSGPLGKPLDSIQAQKNLCEGQKRNQGKKMIVTMKVGNVSIYPVWAKALKEKMVCLELNNRTL